MSHDSSHPSNDFDSRVDRFDAAWHSGSVPKIEDFLPPPDSVILDGQQRCRLVAELVMIDLEFRWRRSRGESAGLGQQAPAAEGLPQDALPGPPRLEDYLETYPELGTLGELPTELIADEYRVRHRWGDRPTHADYLKRFRRHGRELLDALRQMDEELPQAGPSHGLCVRCPHCNHAIDLTSDPPEANVACPSCGSHFSLLRDGSESGAGAQPKKVGHFELLEKLGSGTFGTVWKAHDCELGRIVAVKIPRRTQLDDAQADQFLREARIVAQLNHPNIVGIHEVGRDGGTVFIVTDLVVGDSLFAWLSTRRPSFAETAKLCAKTADALYHAHQAGVIHRDLKPQNIIVDRQGEPKLTDFGLARRETGEVTMTVDGQVLGTPAYMSPEQAQGRSHHADGRTDIYSLGVMLFQMLTGEMPFRGSVHMLMHQIVHNDAPHPRRLNSHVPRDLETICLKCLEKSVAKRYASAEELAAELRRFLHGEPIKARPITRLGRTWRWCRRYPAAAVVVALTLLLAVVGPLVALKQARLASSEAAARKETRRRLYVADMVVAQQAWEAANVGRVRQLLAAHVPRPGQSELRGFQWYYLWQLCQQADVVPTFTGHKASIWSLAFSPNGETLVSGCIDGEVRVWDVHRRKPPASLTRAPGAVLSVAFAPDGETFVAAFGGMGRGGVKVWDVQRRTLLRTLAWQPEVMCAAISSDGKYLAWGAMDGRIHLCDYATLQHQQSFTGRHDRWVTAIAFSPDAKTLVSSSVDFTIKLWDVPTRKVRTTLDGHRNWVRGLAVSPDGTMIASASFDKTAKLWDLNSGRLLRTLVGHKAHLWSVAFSPDSRTLVSASSDGSVKLWDTALGVEAGSLVGHENPTVLAVAYSPDGRTVASAGADARIKLWDVAVPRRRDALVGHSQDVIWVAISPDDKTLASASADATIKLWDTATGALRSTLRGHTSWVAGVAFSRDGTLLASGGHDGTLRLWDLRTGAESKPPLADHGMSLTFCIAFSPDGKTLASTHFDGTVRLWDMKTRQQRKQLLGHNGLVWPVAFSPDGKTLASGGWGDRTVRLWDAATGEPKGAPLEGHTGSVFCVAFAPDSRTLASGAEDETIRLWDVAARTELEVLRGHAGEVRSVAFSPDGRTLASGSSDTTIKLWYLGTDREPETLTGHQAAVSAVAVLARRTALSVGQ